MTPLSSLLETVIFWVILLGVFVTDGIFVRRHEGFKEKGKRKKELFSPLVLLAWLAAAILIGYAGIGVLPDWLFYPGEILFVVGYAFQIYSITLLGRYYSTLVEVQPDHKVIDSGPYRFIRHPNYLGQMVGAVGLGLALQTMGLAAGLACHRGQFLRIPNPERRSILSCRDGRLRRLHEEDQASGSLHLLDPGGCYRPSFPPRAMSFFGVWRKMMSTLSFG